MEILELLSLIRQIDRELDVMFGVANHNSKEHSAVMRRAAYCKCMVSTGISLSETGRLLSKAVMRPKPFDHATVLHNRALADRMIETNYIGFLSVYSYVKRRFDHYGKEYGAEVAKSFIDENFMV